MDRGRRVRAAMVAAAACCFCWFWVSPRLANAGEANDARLILFSGSDLWGNGAFLNGGVIWAPHGADHDGLLLKALISGGVYRYNAGSLGGARVIGTEVHAEVLPGWQIQRGRLWLRFFLGPEIQNDWLRPYDPTNRLRGRSLGAKFAVDLWDEPTPATMIAANASLSSIDTNFTARLAFGWRLLDAFYAGPEAQVYGCDGYRQLRFGAHITGWKTGGAEWSAAGGWSIDSRERGSPYVRLDVMRRL